MNDSIAYLAVPVLVICAVLFAMVIRRHARRTVTWDLDEMARPFLDGA